MQQGQKWLNYKQHKVFDRVLWIHLNEATGETKIERRLIRRNQSLLFLSVISSACSVSLIVIFTECVFCVSTSSWQHDSLGACWRQYFMTLFSSCIIVFHSNISYLKQGGHVTQQGFRWPKPQSTAGLCRSLFLFCGIVEMIVEQSWVKLGPDSLYILYWADLLPNQGTGILWSHLLIVLLWFPSATFGSYFY